MCASASSPVWLMAALELASLKTPSETRPCRFPLQTSWIRHMTPPKQPEAAGGKCWCVFHQQLSQECDSHQWVPLKDSSELGDAPFPITSRTGGQRQWDRSTEGTSIVSIHCVLPSPWRPHVGIKAPASPAAFHLPLYPSSLITSVCLPVFHLLSHADPFFTGPPPIHVTQAESGRHGDRESHISQNALLPWPVFIDAGLY